MGAAAALGALLHVRRAGRGAGLLVPFVLAYATLALVFYTPRFFLVLVPFYLLAAALAFFPRVGARTAPWRRALPVAAGLAVAASAVFAGREVVALLKDTPVEVVKAGRVLRAGVRPGDKLVARKPQVAYFAGMTFVPMPQVETLRELLASARDAGATHLNLSGIELSLRPQFRLLGETDVALPGYTRIARDLSDAEHPFILYRIEPASPADSAFGDSLAVALLDLAARFPLSVEAQAYVGALLLDEGRTADALACLDRAVAIDPRAVQPRAFRAPALYEAGRLDEAARDCEFVIAALARPPAAFHLLLGAVRVQEGRWEEARASFASAAAGEPAHLHARLALATALLALGRDDEARAELAQAERLEPAAAAIGAVALDFAARGDRVGLARLAVRILGGFGTMEAILGLDGPATVAGRANPR
jgi:tetratricopeptide (TPR) repeat protein